MKRGGGQCICFRSFTHSIEFLMNIWWQLILIRSQIIVWSYLCDQNWWNIIKKNRYEFSSSFIHQRLPNMVQRLFADVIRDAIWLMNIHEQKYPWFLAMSVSDSAIFLSANWKRIPLITQSLSRVVVPATLDHCEEYWLTVSHSNQLFLSLTFSPSLTDVIVLS